MEKSLTISNWLRSGEYYTQIDSVLTKIIRNCESSVSESQTASIFETEIYFLVRSQLGIELSISKEERVDGIVHKFDGQNTERVIVHVEDNLTDNTVATYENKNKCNFSEN